MKKIIVLLGIVAIFLPTTILAADLRASQSGTETIAKTEKVKNLYVAGNNVSVEANVVSDLVGAGGNVAVNGNVENDLFIAGGTIDINGNIGKNARIAGGTINIASPKIGEDLLIGGGMVTLKKGAVVGGDLFTGSGTLTLNGIVNGNAKLAGSNITINGTIHGNVVAKNVQNLTVNDGAVIDGTLTYSSPNQASISSKAQIKGKVTHNKIEKNKFEFLGAGVFGISLLYRFIAGFVILILFIYLLPKISRRSVELTYEKFGSNLGWGLLMAIVIPIVALLLLVTILGIKLGFLLGLIFTVFLVIAGIVNQLIIGAGILKLVRRNDPWRIDWLTALVGIIAVIILNFIPIVGWLGIAVFFLATFGMMLRASWGGFNHWRES